MAVGAFVLMAGLGVVLTLIRSPGGDGFGLGGRIAVIEVDGLIADDGELLEQIRRFRRDASVRGFLISINSPGGIVGPSQSLYQELRRLREEEDRPVVATIGAVGASGGYYVALAADSIFALPGSITGSIGVIMEFPDASELLDRVGLRMQVVKSAEHKDTGSPFRPIHPEDRAILEALVQDVYAQFLEAVVSERALGAAQTERVSDGRILSGRQALEIGLVDRLGNFHDALAAAGRMAGLGEEPGIVRPPERRFGVLDLILGRAATRALLGLVRPLQEAAAPRLQYVLPW